MSKDKLLSIVDAYNGLRVIVMGDAMLDEYWIGRVHRISPEAPVPVVNVEEKEFKLGGAANLAHNLSTLGATVRFYGIIALDEAGNTLKKLFKENLMQYLLIEDPEKKYTTKKVRTVSTKNESYQQLLRSDFEDKKTLSKNLEEVIINDFRNKIQESDIVLLSDYGKGFFSPHLTKSIIQIALAEKKKLLSAPKPSGSNYLVLDAFKKSYGIMCNNEEAEKLTHLQYDSSSQDDISVMIKRKFQCKHVIVTQGAKGIFVYNNHHAFMIPPPIQRSVFDVTGAGDTGFATMGLSLAAKATIKEAAILANYAAGLVITKAMTSTISNSELKEVIVNHYT